MNLNLKNSFDESLETNYKVSLEDYNNFVKNIKFNQKENDHTLVKLMHFEFSHWPILFDDQCKNKEDDPDWNKLNPIVQNNFMNKCIGNLIKKVIVKLKAEKVYENSYIIIKGDHGKPNGFYKEDTIEATKLKNSIYWGFGRYKTFFMIKKNNTENESLKINTKNINAGIYLKNIYCKKVFTCRNTNYTHIFLPKSKDNFPLPSK